MLAAPNGFSPTSGSISSNLCIDVNGAVLNSRTITGDLTIRSGNTFTDSVCTLETWTPNGYQAIIPGINVNTPIYCLVTNKGTVSATAVTDIVP